MLAVLSCLPAACDTIRAMDSKRAAKPSVSAPPDRPQMSSGHHVRTRLGGAPPTFFGGSTVERASSRSAGGPYCPMHGHVKVLQPRSGALEQITDALRCKQRRRSAVAGVGQSRCIRRVCIDAAWGPHVDLASLTTCPHQTRDFSGPLDLQKPSEYGSNMQKSSKS